MKLNDLSPTQFELVRWCWGAFGPDTWNPIMHRHMEVDLGGLCHPDKYETYLTPPEEARTTTIASLVKRGWLEVVRHPGERFSNRHRLTAEACGVLFRVALEHEEEHGWENPWSTFEQQFITFRKKAEATRKSNQEARDRYHARNR